MLICMGVVFFFIMAKVIAAAAFIVYITGHSFCVKANAKPRFPMSSCSLASVIAYTTYGNTLPMWRNNRIQCLKKKMIDNKFN